MFDAENILSTLCIFVTLTVSLQMIVDVFRV